MTFAFFLRAQQLRQTEEDERDENGVFEIANGGEREEDEREELEKDIGDLETRSGFGERKTEESDFGEFGWIKDGEGKRLELWRLPEGM